MRARRALARIALALGSIVVAIAGAEGIYRASLAAEHTPGGDEGWAARYRRMNETLYRASDDPELVYEPVPGSALEMEYGIAAFNSAGMRDDREHSEARDDRARIAILGDSIVWSELVSLEDSLPRQVERALGAGHEVLAFGVTGYDTAQEARWYERAVRRFAPDAVVLVYCMNDLMIMSGPFERFATGAARARKDAQDALFAREAPVRRETIDQRIADREREAPIRVLARAWGVWERARFEDEYIDEYLVAARDEERWARVEDALERLGAAIRADGAIAILAISPVLESWDRYRWSALHARVRASAERAGFRVLDPLEPWRASGEEPERLRIGGDNLHYRERGLALLGRAIAAEVEEAIAR